MKPGQRKDSVMRRIVPFVLTGFVALWAVSVGQQAETKGAPQLAQTSAEKPLFERAPDALERVTWRTRTLVGDDRLTDWNLAIPATGGQGDSSFIDGVLRADAALVDFVEGSSTQTVSREIQKRLDQNLTADEIAAVRARMKGIGNGSVRMLTYRVERMPGDARTRRRLFEFARAMDVGTIVVPSNTGLEGLDALADEFGINVAVLGDAARPLRTVKALEGKGKRLGIGADTGMWVREGVSPQDALAIVKDRLQYIFLSDRGTRSDGARNVLLGQGAGNFTALFHELNRQNVRPLAVTLDTRGLDLFQAVAAFEQVVQPAFGEHFTAYSRSRPIRWDLVTAGRGEKLAPEAKRSRSKSTRPSRNSRMPGLQRPGSSSSSRASTACRTTRFPTPT
jgi:sugar phosphate isomerase/epimerase